MPTATMDPQSKIDLADGLSLWLATPQQRAAAGYVVNEIFKKRRYDYPGFQIQPTDTIVDIGANMGVFVLWAARQAPQGKVIAIEPTSAIDVLRLNLARNGITNVAPVQAAAGNDGGTFEIVTYPGFNIVNHHAGWQPKMWTKFFIWLLYRKYQSAPVTERAPVKSLRKILDENGVSRVNYLKCDCEGGEYEIFRELDDDTFARIDKIAMEFHEYAPDQHRSELIELLNRNGFRVEVHKSWFEYTFMKYGMLWAVRK
ncbi:MAG TPA: FkbM family methyltransferase [Pirellulales bacterium]|jgi:FkbM family methyltransferase|nr:FkbM family methyltransferase [Pirellulales bacterium]